MPPEPPDSIADALASGDADRVNRVIDLVEGLSVEERADAFDAYVDVARTVSDADDGYVRQSAVRFAEALHPGLALRAVGRMDTADPVPGEYTLADAAVHRQRLRELFLEALLDEDGRVRKAAVKGVKTVAVAADVIDERDELEGLLAELESAAEAADEAAEVHVRRAADQVSFYLDRSPSLLPDGLLDGLERGR